jgi:hypothetical protein
VEVGSGDYWLLVLDKLQERSWFGDQPERQNLIHSGWGIEYSMQCRNYRSSSMMLVGSFDSHKSEVRVTKYFTSNATLKTDWALCFPFLIPFLFYSSKSGERNITNDVTRTETSFLSLNDCYGKRNKLVAKYRDTEDPVWKQLSFVSPKYKEKTRKGTFFPFLDQGKFAITSSELKEETSGGFCYG